MTKEEAKLQVCLARVQNWLNLRLAKAGYPHEAKVARGMRRFHMEEARLYKR